MSRRRRKMNRRSSRKSFSRNAGTHKLNLTRSSPRGGIRL